MPTAGRRQLLSDHVRDLLLQGIHAGRWDVGEKLPNEHELGRTFGVSRVTLREAVRSLVEAGYLNRVHGSGTYVAFRPSARHSLDRNLSYTRLIEEAGMRFARRVLNVTREPASADEAERMGIRPGDEVARVERVRLADDRPVIYSLDAIPAAILPGHISDEDLSGSLYELLRHSDHEVVKGDASLVPVLATPSHAEVLEVAVGSPLLHLDQVDVTNRGQPVMRSLEWHVPGVFELALVRRAE